MSALSLARRQRIPLGPALARRGWLVLVTMVAVGVLAYAVSHVQATTYTSYAAVAVSPALGPATPGNAQQSLALATTYAAAMPKDERLSAAVRSLVGSGGGSFTAFATPGTAVITVIYSASTPAAAVKGADAVAAVGTSPNPAGSTVTPGSLQAIQHPTSARRFGSTWRAAAILLVAPGAGPAGGIDADRANKLATTYAGVMQSDDTLLARTGQAVGVSKDDVRANLSVVNLPNSSILEIAFKADSPSKAVLGARTVTQLVMGAQPAAATIVPNSLNLVTTPTSASTHSGGSGTAIPIGLLIGLALGLVLLVAWERSDPHVGEAADLSEQLGTPATAVAELTPDTARALLHRWAGLTERVPARVAILPANTHAQAASEHLVQMFVEAGGEHVAYEDARSAPFTTNGSAPAGTLAPTGDLVLVQAGPPNGAGAGQATALKCDLTVVVVPYGMRAAELRSLASNLAEFGIAPDWSLLTPRRESAPAVGERARATVG